MPVPYLPKAYHFRWLLWLFFASIVFCTLSQAQPVDKAIPQRDVIPTHSLELSTSSTNLYPLKLKCEDVHKAKDKCAFIKIHCGDYDSGLLDYLDLYFCQMYAVFPLYWTIAAAWLLALFVSIGVSAGDFLTPNLSVLSWRCNMSSSLAGVTFLALGNGSPDLFSTFTAMSNHSGSLAIGELIGAAGFITTCVAAATSLPGEFHVKRYAFIRDVTFFAVAVAFSLYFLIDGRLALWECAIMVIFYMIYVATVFSWDFILARIRKRKTKHARARGNFTTTQTNSRPREPSPVAMGDFDGDVNGTSTAEGDALLGDGVADPDDDEEGPGTRDEISAQLSEFASQMRFRNRSGRSFSRMASSEAPFRPSLLAAAEFNSVLSSLERSRAATGGGISSHSRSLSVDPRLQLRSGQNHSSSGAAAQRGAGPIRSVSESAPLLEPGRAATSRLRSVSVSAATALSRTTNPTPETGAVSPALLSQTPSMPVPAETRRPDLRLEVPQVPSIIATDESGQRSALTADGQLVQESPTHTDTTEVLASPASITPLDIQPRWMSSGSRSPWSSVVGYLRRVNLSVFPEFKRWPEKRLYHRVLTILSIPIILVLTLTVPVADVPEWQRKSVPASNEQSRSNQQNTDTSSRKTGAESQMVSQPRSLASSVAASPLLSPVSDPGEIFQARHEDDESWNPYICSIHIMTAPLFFFFVAYKGWLNIEDDGVNTVIWACSILGVSSVLFVLFWYTNIPNRAPVWQSWLAIPGFLVAVAWISMIADEIVGVLKAFQLITGFSEAILGLLIFAAGNSVSDIFANHATAKAGRPGMAFHACFGGPMLNILLGIGLGGMYHTIQKGRKHGHDGGASLGTEFHIDVDRTLIVSGIGLLLSLLAISVAIWLNGWVMDRKIGYGLVTGWFFITFSNIALELLQMKGYVHPW